MADLSTEKRKKTQPAPRSTVNEIRVSHALQVAEKVASASDTPRATFFLVDGLCSKLQERLPGVTWPLSLSN